MVTTKLLGTLVTKYDGITIGVYQESGTTTGVEIGTGGIITTDYVTV